MSLSHIAFQDLTFIQAASTVSSEENGQAPYILCNEEKQTETLVELERMIQASSSIDNTNTGTHQSFRLHIGFSVWFNLDLLAVTQPDFAIILDIDPMVNIIYKNLQLALQLADTREKFIQTFLDLVANSDLLSFPKETQEQLLKNLMLRKNGFLSSEKEFLIVKSMCLQGKIFFGLADLTNEEQMSLLRAWCKTNNMKISTYYVSNIPEWVIGYQSLEKRKLLINNIENFCDPDTLVIDAYYPTSQKKRRGASATYKHWKST